MSHGETSKRPTNAPTALRCSDGRMERRIPTSSSATVITDSMQSETGGRSTSAARPRSSATQTEVSSIYFTEELTRDPDHAPEGSAVGRGPESLALRETF